MLPDRPYWGDIGRVMIPVIGRRGRTGAATLPSSRQSFR